MSHDCIKNVNEQLAPYNTTLAWSFSLSGRELVSLETCKVDPKKRGKPMKMFASYCPFCGEKLAVNEST